MTRTTADLPPVQFADLPTVLPTVLPGGTP
jgi:hypothetical protein